MGDMKLILSIVAYLLIAGVLGWGIMLALKGSFWLLIVATITYLLMFSKFGCLPKQSH